MSVRVDEPGASRSFTEPQLSSSGVCSSDRRRRTEAEPGAETVPTVSVRGPARCLLRLPSRAGINGRGFVRHTSWWAVRCSGHSYHCACAIDARAGAELNNKPFELWVQYPV
eukprot:superscaffoldBa00012330_g25615